jgi:hypothetical protein
MPTQKKEKKGRKRKREIERGKKQESKTNLFNQDTSTS